MPEAPVIIRPEKQISALELSGNEFAEKLKVATDQAEAKKAEAEAATPANVDAPEKVDEPSKPDEKAPKKTPLDIASAKTEKKPDAPAVEEEIASLISSEPPANASPSSKANHAAMRKGLERADAKIKEMARELEEARGKTSAGPAEVETKLKETQAALAERDALIERVAFERSPKFQAFIKNSEAELTAAKAYIPDRSEVNPNVIDLAARAVGAKRAAILNESGMDATTIGLVGSHLARADAINREREAAQENWKATQAEWGAEQQKAQETRSAQVKANEDKIFSAVGKKVAETLAPYQKTNGENPEWDSGVDARFSEAQEYFDGKKPLEAIAEVIYNGLACETYRNAFEDLRTKYNDLVVETERITAAKPGAASVRQDAIPRASSGDAMKDAGNTFEANLQKAGV